MNNRLDAGVVGDRSISMDRPTWDMRKTVTLYRMEAPRSLDPVHGREWAQVDSGL